MGTEGAAAPSRPDVWVCPGCGLPHQTHTMHGLDAANDHWQFCSKPTEDMIKRRERRGLDERIVPISPTALDVFDMCPRQSWAKSHMIQRTASGNAAKLGTALHAYAETGVVDFLADLPAEELEEYFEFLPAVDALKAASPFEKEPDHIEYESVVNVEYPLSDGRIGQLQMKIDRVSFFGTAAVIDDWKSGRLVPENATQMQAKSNQSRCYPVAVLRTWPWVTHVVFRIGVVREKKVITSPWWSADQVRDMDALIGKKVERYAAETEWRATPGPHCSNMCDFVKRCRGAHDLLDGWQLVTVLVPADLSVKENLVKAVQAYELVQAQQESLHKAIKERALTKNTGPVDLPDGRVWGWGSEPKTEMLDPRRFLEEVLPQHVKGDESPYKYVTFNRKAAAVKRAEEAAPEGVVKKDSYGACKARDPQKQKSEEAA